MNIRRALSAPVNSIKAAVDAHQAGHGPGKSAAPVILEPPASMCAVRHINSAAVHSNHLEFPECADIGQEVADSSARRQRRVGSRLHFGHSRMRGGPGAGGLTPSGHPPETPEFSGSIGALLELENGTARHNI